MLYPFVFYCQSPIVLSPQVKPTSRLKGIFQWTNESKRYRKKEPQTVLRLNESEPYVLNEERRRAILDLLTNQGRVLVTELSRHFETSQVTIRKDLEILHSRGLVHRTHGGALPAREGALEDPTLREKEKLHRQEKMRIAENAAMKVKEGQVVILDSGTTTTTIARALRNFKNLTIITNAVNIAAELAGTAVEVILTGGTVRKNSFSLVGPIAEETLHRLTADLLFLGVDGFDVHYGLSTPNLLEAKVNRVMVEISKKIVAVCDSSKFGRRSLSLIAPVSMLHEVITDRGLSKTDLRALKQAGVEVTLV
jgi:DeoR family transcriptional regulator, aga operon transcriptional repressor